MFRETNTRQEPTHAPGRQQAPLQQAAASRRAAPCRPAPGRLQDPSRPHPRAGAVPHRHRSQQAKPAQPGLASPSLAAGKPRTLLLTPEVRRRNGHQALQRAEHSAPRYIRAPSPHHEHPPATAADSRPCRSRARSASGPAPHVPPYQSDSSVLADATNRKEGQGGRGKVRCCQRHQLGLSAARRRARGPSRSLLAVAAAGAHQWARTARLAVTPSAALWRLVPDGPRCAVA